MRGGLVDLEFIAQYLELSHAARHPQVLSTNTTDAFARLADCGCLARGTADELIAATRLWRRVQGILRLGEGRDFEEERAPEGLRRVIARAAGAASFTELKGRLGRTAERVAAHFAALIEGPAAACAARVNESPNRAKEALS